MHGAALAVNIGASEVGQAAPATDADLLPLIRHLVDEHRERLFPGIAADIDIIDLSLGPAGHFQETRFGRSLDIRYRHAGTALSRLLWLKFRPGLDELFPLLLHYEHVLEPRVFPRPCFAWRSVDGAAAIVATDFADGMLMRDRFRQWAFSRQTARLEPIFRSNGTKMRAFHDASPALPPIAVDEVVATIVGRLGDSRHLTAAEREVVLRHVERCRAELGSRSFVGIRTHNDWVLRNIMIGPDGDDCIIDTDDMQGAPHWRWHDVGLFLLDIDTQLKWYPLTTRRMLARLARAFWQGYAAGRDLPDGLDAARLPALFYLVRLQWLVEGVIHQPHFEILLDGLRRNRRIRRWLTEAVAAGRCSLVDLPLAG